MATTPSSRTIDTPEDIKKRRWYWGIALTVIVLVALGLIRNRYTQSSSSRSDSNIAAPAATDTVQNRGPTSTEQGTPTSPGTNEPVPQNR